MASPVLLDSFPKVSFLAGFKTGSQNIEDSKLMKLLVNGCPPKEPTLEITKLVPVRLTPFSWTVNSTASPAAGLVLKPQG